MPPAKQTRRSAAKVRLSDCSTLTMRPPLPIARPTWLDRGHIPSLDGLRAVAVLLVFVAHVHKTAGFPDIHLLHTVGPLGAIGVDVFFVLSGFLITTLLCRERE